MKNVVLFLTIVFLFTLTSCAQDEVKELKDQKEKVSYSIGLDIGRNLKNQKIEVDSKVLAQGIKDAIGDKKPLLTEDEISQVMAQFQQEHYAQQEKEKTAISEKNKTEGQKFLEENKKNKDIVTLPSGLQYKVLKSGSGISPSLTDKVKTHYIGKFLDGTEFDNSIKRGEPAEFPVNGVIKGWTEALQKMKVGDKWILYVPPDLAYGEQGAGNVIPPNATLIFEVELLSIEK
ncbi:MAG: macrophage infectivity potentiator Mip [Ignavibacterium sp.]